jgi:hypothetical protein
MKRTATILGLVLTAAVTANAQGKAKVKRTTGNRSMLVAQNTTATTAPTTQTSATSAAAATAAPASKISGLLLYESYATKDDVQNNKGSALVDAVTSIGVSYKVNPKNKIGIRHRFQVRNRADKDLTADQSQGGDNALNSDNGQGDQALTKLADTTLHYDYSSDLRFLGSNPITISSRYYAPVSRDSMDAKMIGTFRSQVNPEWDLNTKVTLNFLLQGRLYVKQADAKGASDSTLRLIAGPGATYNFTDKLNAYYTVYTDQKSNN